MSMHEHPEDMFLTNSIIPSANSLKAWAAAAAWEFTIAEKSKISASFLRVDVRDGLGSKISNNYDWEQSESNLPISVV